MSQFTVKPWDASPRFLAVAVTLLLLSGCTGSTPPTLQGYVEGEFISMASSEGGRLERLLVTKGERIPAGAPLFTLESRNEALLLRQTDRQWSAAQARLKDLRSGKRDQELEVIRAQLAQAVAKEKAATKNLARESTLFNAGIVSRGELDDVRALAEEEIARVHELEGQLAVARLAARDEQIREQAATTAAARAILDQAAWKLGEKGVTAPAAALVFDTLYKEGEWVPAGAPVVRLLPPENVKVRFFAPQPLLGRLSPGKAVVLSCDGSPAEIPARITYISTEAEYTPPVIYSNETRAKLVFLLEARPTAAAPQLHPGQPVSVRMP